METVSIAEAKSKLSQLIHQTENGKAVQLSRHGKPVAVLLSQQQYKRLTDGEDPWEAIVKWRSNASFKADNLSDQEVNSWRDRATERKFSWEE